ncbi:MAG: hypothetical protein HY659_12765 [Rhizobiales bacterium]|nr:hypothetical protein [Hyphomicrobiales bacterium]
MGEERARHLPQLAPIDGYGHGGFRFAGMSHRGSLLCLPSGIWAWPPVTPAEITDASLAPVFAEAADVGFFLIGTGRERWAMPAGLWRRFHETQITVEVMRTGDAANTFNILLGEGRRVGAALIAVD